METVVTRDALFDPLPASLRDLQFTDKLIPQIAKDTSLTNQIAGALKHVPTRHHLHCGDARTMRFLKPNSVHLIVTSPPYWTLKRYREGDGQLGHVEDYDEFLVALDTVWQQCFEALVHGGRLVCVVGDVCLSRRKNNGRHTVVPLHASIHEHSRKIGYDNLSPIIWHKIANAVYEVEGTGGFLGKPYEPNAVIKNASASLSVLDIERRSHELLVQSFHLFDDNQMVIKTQAIIEVIKSA